MDRITPHIPAIATLCREHKVKYLWVFGSVLTDRFSDQSDVDILVDFLPFDLKTNSYAKNYFSLINGLENVFNRAIDLVTVSSLRNRLFIDELNRTRLKVYDGTESQQSI
ncbi:MAG: nucleotidyltransferase domain-containing protein [Bacteroidales bacterium]|nr:nucleotidyltransferase domain-containing protein [Bacteroidales bacterium]